MASWAAGKLTRPAIRQALGYLQTRYPDSVLTPSVAKVATSDAPLAPSEEAPLERAAGDNAVTAGVPPDEADVDEAAPDTGSSWFSNRAQSAIRGRTQRWAAGKLQGIVWQQVCMPLTALLWLISLLLVWLEERAAARAAVPKEQAAHERDVARVVSVIQARPEGAKLAIKPTSAHVSHMLRTRDVTRSVGPASALQAANSSSSSSSADTQAQVPIRWHLVDLSKLNKLLNIDAMEGIATVEAGMTFSDFVRATTAQRLMPTVVPPFPSMTVGGAFIGGAIGSSSGLYGSFASSVVSVSVITGAGELVTAGRAGPRAELFHALAGSYHTMGTVVSLTVELVRAPRYMHLQYESFKSVDKAVERVQSLLDKRYSNSILAVEALVFSPKLTVVATACGVDVIDPRKHKVQSFARYWDQSYASYVRHWATLQQAGSVRRMPEKHCCPLTDYLFRYEQQSFWLADFVYHLMPIKAARGNTFVARILAGWPLNDANMRATVANDRDMQIKLGQLRIIQDAHIPIMHVSKFVTWQLDAIGVAPLWLCPVLATPSKLLDASLQHSPVSSASSSLPKSGQVHYMNVGMYGRPAQGAIPYSGDDVNEELITQVYRAGGRTLLYAHNWHDAELLRQMYDTKRYEAARDEFHATDAYQHLFSKVMLNDADRADMRKPFQQPEKPLLNAIARKFARHQLGI